ncbi:MAG: hypothetical protein MUC50_05420 [Myxococcota bacterium]|jgi:hypothetical protein|nr:hypothetical protein [Myxococcota bacterium]
MKKVFICGEGPNELGGWAYGLAYVKPNEPGVLEILLRQVRIEGWAIQGARRWKDIRKFRAGNHRSPETRNVLGAVLEAKESGCDVIAFIRDRDGTHANDNHARVRDVDEGISQARKDFGHDVLIVGGVAIRKLESWLTAISGKNGSEALRQPEDYLEKRCGLARKDSVAFSEFIEKHGLSKIPEDATSLLSWLNQARLALQ